MKTFEFTVSRTIRGAADEVFDAWLDPKSPGGHTWVSEATRGLETVVTITLAPQEGWAWYLNVLVERFEKVAAR